MANPIYFVQECPTCGRNLQIRVEYLGKGVACQHCAANFEACDPSSGNYPPMESSLALLDRADQLILQAAVANGVESGSQGEC